jgi:glycerol-3-phosphate O-acyltransferase/dihydroxyacetone phosphate acyltransferase
MVARTYVPDFVPLWLFAMAFYAHMVFVSYAALRFGEVGMDIIKSLPPLIVALNPLSSTSLTDLREHREALSELVTETIDDLGFGISPDVDAEIPSDTYRPDAYQSRLKSMPPSEPSSRELSRSRSRGPAGAPQLKGLSSINTKGDLDLEQIDRKIQTQLKGRGRRANTINAYETGESILKYKMTSGTKEDKKKR